MTVNEISRFDPQRLSRLADGLAIALAVSVPWSTSATGILAVLWVIAVVPTLSWSGLRREVATPAGGLPVLLFLLGALGMLWAGVAWAERLHGLSPFWKLLTIPLLIVQFRRSDRAAWAFGGYLLSCAVLLLASYVVAAWPALAPSHDFGVPVKNAATQSGEFATCILVLLFLAHERLLQRQWARAAGLAALMLAMLADIFFIATGRTALVVLLVLVGLFAVRRLSLRGIALLFAAGVVVIAAGWLSSPYLRERVTQAWTDAQKYRADNNDINSSGERIEFAKKSIHLIREAPVIGHGTGSMHALFIQSAAGKTGTAGIVTTNPHNQTFAVAIQLGLIGAAVLWAMWIAHLWLFRGGGLTAWIGFVLVVQNVVGSAFNSHVFDFVQGWTYAVGVGIAAGAVLKDRASKP
jgi:O-antigen ligase